jgi:hypothetical protein
MQNQEELKAKIKEWVGEENVEPTENFTVDEKRETIIHSLAHLRLQQNGHNIQEAIDWAFNNVDSAINTLNNNR